MSWIDKELKRREVKPAAAPTVRGGSGTDSQTQDDTAAMQRLWDKIEALNAALPEPLRLRSVPNHKDGGPLNTPAFRVWLVAEGGAGLGFNGDGMRYFWPVAGRRRSHNFWVRWHASKGYTVTQRLGSSWGGASVAEAPFKAGSVDHIIRCLVQGRCVSFRSVKARSWWWPF
jgi:hypothetical protein